MKRRFPGSDMPGRARPQDPRFLSGGGGGQPVAQHGGGMELGRFPGRGGPRQPLHVGFQGRGRTGPNIPGRGGPRPNFPGRGPQYFNMQGRGTMGRGMGRPPMMGRGRGPISGIPPIMGPGPPMLNIPPPPPPPPRGPVGYTNTNVMRPPQPPHQGIPQLSMHGQQPSLGMGPTPGLAPQRSFPRQQLQQGPHNNITGTLPHTGPNPSNPFPTNHGGGVPRSNLVQGSSLPTSAPPAYTPAYSNVPVASAAAIATPSQGTVSTPSHASHQAAQATPRPTADQVDQAWKEYTAPNGMKYYHNAILKESTYTKPITLTKGESPVATQEKRKWQEYEDSVSGKKYYSDGVTTTWEKPEDFVNNSDAQKVAETIESEPVKKRKKPAIEKESPFANKEEAIAAFKGLLLAKGIVPTIKWNEVVKLCSSDSRWEVCEDALSVGERRQALAEYQTKRANELRSLERQEKIRAKEAFGQLLSDVLLTVTGFSAWSSRFSDVRATLAKDDRFHAVAAEETRESLFLDFCEEFRKRDERKKRNKKREAHDAFLSFLGEKEETGTLTFASTWDSFLSSLDQEEKKDDRFEVSAAMSASDRQLYFADFVIELQSAEDDKRRRIRDAHRRAEQAQREAYRDLLRKLGAEGKILPSTRWRSIEERLSLDESFNLVLAQDRDSPRALFEDFVREWDDYFHLERSFLSRLLNPPNKKGFHVKVDTSYDEFTKILLEEAAHSQDVYGDTRRIINRKEPVSSARLYYDELVSQATNSHSRLGSLNRRPGEESSEDEGEIIEDESEQDVRNGTLEPSHANYPKDSKLESNEGPAASDQEAKDSSITVVSSETSSAFEK